MKKIIVAFSFFVSLHIYAIPEGLNVQYVQKAVSLANKSKDATKIMHHLLAVTEERPLNKVQEKQLVNAVCESVRFDREFFKYLATDINQARIMFADDQLNEKSLIDKMKDSLEYKFAQQLIGTPNECKH